MTKICLKGNAVFLTIHSDEEGERNPWSIAVAKTLKHKNLSKAIIASSLAEAENAIDDEAEVVSLFDCETGVNWFKLMVKSQSMSVAPPNWAWKLSSFYVAVGARCVPNAEDVAKQLATSFSGNGEILFKQSSSARSAWRAPTIYWYKPRLR